MKKLFSTIALLLIITFSSNAFSDIDTTFMEKPITLQTSTGKIFGTLTMPEMPTDIPIALIIAGSGPTDRDGNNPMASNNSLKFLAHELAINGIASVRFDKRGIAESKEAGKREDKLRFDDYVNDAKEWISMLKKDKRFTKVIVIGHSEGSLIGMLASAHADQFISIAGAGRSADNILKIQLSNQPANIQDLCFPIIDSLRKGKTVDDVNLMLMSLFRPAIQPYLISWFTYDPQKEIKKLTIATLILQGTNDLQISKEDAQLLASANPKAQLFLVNNMNHILKIVEADKTSNLQTYSNPTLPISDELISNIKNFIFQH